MRPTEPQLDEQLATPEPKATRFLRLLFLFIGSALALVGGFNWLADPFSLYGSPVKLDRWSSVRLEKLDLLRRADPPPEALILGSSRVRVLPPAGVRYLFGLRAFHLGGPKSSPQYWLSLVRYAVDDLGYPIRLVILGVDPSSFVDETNYLKHPVNTPELRANLRHPYLSRLRSFVHLWSPTQTRASVALVRATVRSDRANYEELYLWDKEGFLRHSAPLDAVKITETAIDLHRSHGTIEREHLDDFEAFVEFAAAREITIVAYLTPEAPPLTRALSGTHYPDTIRKTREILRAERGKGLIFCEVDSLGLRKPDFVDPHHPTMEAGLRILGTLRRCAGEQGFN